MNYLGIDIGGTAVKLGIVTDKGDVLHTHSKDVAFDDYETPMIETVLVAVDELIDKYHIQLSELGGIGVSATGQIDYREGVVIGVGGNIKNWLGTAIKDRLEEKYKLKTTVVNDANCMILGEAWVGAAADYDHVIGITIGTGVGGGILIDHNILHGKLGIAAELGHFSIAHEGALCTCGNVGCYEQYASMTALVKTVKSKQQELGIKGDINGKVIFETVKNG
ncbi:MAG: ROK family protein, partial [Turicibacter sp.]